MAALNRDETKTVGEARDLLRYLVKERPDLSPSVEAQVLRAKMRRLASELNNLYAVKGYYPS